MKRIKIHWDYIGFGLSLVLGLTCLLTVSMGSRQASMPIPMHQQFVGEYSYGGDVWYPLTEVSELSALDGDLLLRGHFLQPIMEGGELFFYRNHIGVVIELNGEPLYLDEISATPEMDPKTFSSMCAREWISFISPGITTEDLVEIRLNNPHRAGNREAYRDFLNTMCVTVRGPELLERNLERYSQPMRIGGVVLSVAALLLLGAAITSILVRIPVWDPLLKAGLMSLLAGGAIVFDTVDISFWSELNALNTYGLQLCIMLGVFSLQQFISDLFTGKIKRVGKTILLLSGGLNALLILLSLAGVTVIFDTLPVWGGFQAVACPILILCCVAESRRAGGRERSVLFSGGLLFATLLLDLAGVGSNILIRGIWTKSVFMILFVVYSVLVLRRVMQDHQGAMRVKRLEQELEDSRIAIMLSQIKPHFLYNVLNAIYHLYRKEPETAQEAVSSFAEYLRCNMLSIEKNQPISFREEYRHIQTYLSLEQIRFRGKLDVVYDVEVSDFKLPPLTVEPLVENAVKHGISKKRGGGIVTISTRRTQEGYSVTVADTGPGFDPEHYMQDGKPHVGIRNVKQRLHSMVGGSLSITSSISGTTAVVTIPVKEEKHRDEDHRRR